MSAARTHLGLIGFGAIAQDLCALLQARATPPRITVLLRNGSASATHLPQGLDRVASVAELLAAEPDLIVEAAGHAAAREYAPAILKAGVPVVIASAGALAESELLTELMQLSTASGTALIVPSGAVGGLDYLGAVRAAAGVEVRYTSRKPPAAWREELAARGIDPASLKDEAVLFEGSAVDAAKLYPRNLNVAATLALAGIGMNDTRVRVVADPRVSENVHEIEITSEVGRASMTFQNFPSRLNPKTSMLTAYSVALAIDRHRQVLKI